jgi:hypothetical protein
VSDRELAGLFAVADRRPEPPLRSEFTEQTVLLARRSVRRRRSAVILAAVAALLLGGTGTTLVSTSIITSPDRVEPAAPVTSPPTLPDLVEPTAPATGPPSQPERSASYSSTACTSPGVVKCVRFDAAADFNTGAGGRDGAQGQRAGILPPYGTTNYTRVTRDTSVKASGASSMRFTIPAKSPADSSGSYFTNFSDDLSVQFGENSEFYVQWRQRFSPEFLATKYAGGEGWQQFVVGTGDTRGKIQDRCTSLQLVVKNSYHRGFPQMSHSCSGSSSHRAHDPFEQLHGAYDYKLQNGRPAPFCLYSQADTSYFAPTGNCFGYVANEWMTFQIRVKTGPRRGDEFVNSHITLWIAREGKPSATVIDWGPYNLAAGPAGENQRFGKVWLLPYNDKRGSSATNPVAYTWYDELVISRNRIPDP